MAPEIQPSEIPPLENRCPDCGDTLDHERIALGDPFSADCWSLKGIVRVLLACLARRHERPVQDEPPSPS